MGTITRSFVNGLTTNGVLGTSNINNASLNNITSIAGPEMTLISSATASSSASIEFSLGDYKEYQFYFVNMHPQNSNIQFQVNYSTDNGSNYNVTKTSTFFRAIHAENDSLSTLGYRTGEDLAQSTNFQPIMYALDIDNDSNGNGFLKLFNPSSTTYVKHWISDCSGTSNDGGSNRYDIRYFGAGYANTTSPLTNIKFQMSSGNIDAGSIYMYGIGA